MAEELFRINIVQSIQVLELALPHSIDPLEFDRLTEALLQATRTHAGGRWVFDLKDVSYMGSATLGLMVNLRQQIKQAQGKLALCNMSERLLQIFHACCMERLFTIVHNREDALRVIAKR